jgi:tetratricopeptide (TPR) repeat protein
MVNYFSGIALGDYIAAIRDYSKAIDLSPKFAATYGLRAEAKKLEGDYENALEDANMAIELEPQEAALYNDRGVLHIKLNAYQEAIRLLQENNGSIWCWKRNNTNKPFG